MLFGWFICENIATIYNYFVVIYHDGDPVLAGEFEIVIEYLDDYYFNSIIKKVIKKGNTLKFYLSD